MSIHRLGAWPLFDLEETRGAEEEVLTFGLGFVGTVCVDSGLGPREANVVGLAVLYRELEFDVARIKLSRLVCTPPVRSMFHVVHWPFFSYIRQCLMIYNGSIIGRILHVGLLRSVTV